MKYVLKELLKGVDQIDDSRNLGNRECNSMDEVVALMKEMEGQGLELKMRKEKRDYDKIIMVELYFKRPPPPQK